MFPVAWPPGADPWTRDPGTQSDDGYGNINGTINGNRHSGRNGDRQLATLGDLDARSVIPAAPAG